VYIKILSSILKYGPIRLITRLEKSLTLNY